jgi:hypothetical protein
MEIMKRSSIFWGIVLILAAGLLLMEQFNIISDFFSYFWVFALLLVGVWLIVAALTRSKHPGERVTVSLEGATSARVKLDHGAGRLTLRAGAVPGNLLDGECNPGPVIKTRTDGNHLEARLKATPEFWMWTPGESRDWTLALAKDIPLALDIDSGASTSTIDLRDLKVTELDLDTGASTNDITLPANAGLTRVKINSGAATMHIRIPEGVAAQIRVESGLASINVDSRFPNVGRKLYLSPDYSTAANRADVMIETGMATVEIK